MAKKKKQKRGILGTVFKKGRTFLPENDKDAEDLAKILSPIDAKRLRDKGVLSEDFEGELQIHGEEEGEDVDGTPLPGGFPARMILLHAGYNTLEKVAAASDEDLDKLDDVGEATIAKIRAALP